MSSSDLSASLSSSTDFIDHPVATPLSSSEADLGSFTEDYDDEELEEEDASEADTEEQLSDAELEWQESMKQLELLLSMVIVPFAGKWLGRKTAFWVWARVMQWKYPVDVIVTSKAAVNIGGLVGAASISAPAL